MMNKSIRQLKNNFIDNLYLDSLTLNCFHNKIKIDNIPLQHLINQKNINRKQTYQWFISIQPFRYISNDRLKYLFTEAYIRYLHYKNGKKYRKKDFPFKFYAIFEHKDPKQNIRFNHLHIITENLSIENFQKFIGIIFNFLQHKIGSIDILSENIWSNKSDCVSYGFKYKINNHILTTNDAEIRTESDLL